MRIRYIARDAREGKVSPLHTGWTHKPTMDEYGFWDITTKQEDAGADYKPLTDRVVKELIGGPLKPGTCVSRRKK